MPAAVTTSRAIRAALRGLVYATIALATLELCARVDDHLSYGAPFMGQYEFDNLHRYGVGGVYGVPGERFEKWRMNNLGFRGRDVPPRKAPEHFRVLVLGASESFGIVESPEMEYPAQLERVLAGRLGRPVEVLNGAFPGMSLPRVLEFCASHLATLDADVVLYYPSPASYLGDRAPATMAVVRGPAPKRPLPRIARRTEGVAKALLPEATQDWLRTITGKRRSVGESWGFSDVPADRVRIFAGHLEELIDCVQGSGARLVLSTHANRFAQPLSPSEERYLEGWRRFYPRARDSVLIEMDARANAAIRDLGMRRGVPVADLASAVAPDPRNFHDSVHFTDRGSAVAAVTFAETILAEAVRSRTPADGQSSRREARASSDLRPRAEGRPAVDR
jgi:hypothetical protein